MQPPHDPKQPPENPCIKQVQLKYINCRNRFEEDYDLCLLQWTSHAEPYCARRAREETLRPSDLARYKKICVARRLSEAECNKVALELKQEETRQMCLRQVIEGGYYWDHLPTHDPESKSAEEFCANEWVRPCAEARNAAIKKCLNP